MKFLKCFIFLFFCFMLPSTLSAGNVGAESVLVSLVGSLESKQEYEAVKLEKIAKLKQKKHFSSQQDRFKTYQNIYDEYASYQYDSAYVYANHLLKIADSVNNADYIHAEPYQKKYVRRGNIYTDSLLYYLAPQCADYLYAVGIRHKNLLLSITSS